MQEMTCISGNDLCIMLTVRFCIHSVIYMYEYIIFNKILFKPKLECLRLHRANPVTIFNLTVFIAL